MYEERQRQMSKPLSDTTSQWIVSSDDTFEGNPYDLIKAMNRLIRRKSLETMQETTMQIYELSTEERLEQIKNRFKHVENKIDFEILCEDCTSVHMVIVSFLAILDMIRSGDLNFYVEKERIWLMKGEDVRA